MPQTIYLDSNATTPVLPAAIAAATRVMAEHYLEQTQYDVPQYLNLKCYLQPCILSFGWYIESKRPIRLLRSDPSEIEMGK